VRSDGSPYNPDMPLKLGDRAPDFTLVDTAGESVKLSELRGRPVVLIFLRWLG
jgi:mycoredoxin-dependent peroxiredoxin